MSSDSKSTDPSEVDAQAPDTVEATAQQPSADADSAAVDASANTSEPDAKSEQDRKGEQAAVAGQESTKPTAADGKEGSHLSVVPVEPLADEHIRCVLEAALLAADDAVTVDRLYKLFAPGELAEEGGKAQVRAALDALGTACEDRGFELKKVASGYRLQVRQKYSPWVSRLWEEKPPRYTRALLETMALIAYKQPATRGDIEEVRGVTVSSNIMRTLLERGWIREVGHRDVPGRPSMYGTTKEFLDYFNLSSLDQLPSLPEIRELIEPAAEVADDVLDDLEESRSEATKALLAENAEDEDGVISESAEADADPAQGTDAGADHSTGETVDAAADQNVIDENLEDSASVVDAGGDELKSVPAPDGEELTNTGAPVFADNEVLVVSETATVEVQSESTLATLPSADAKE